MGTELLGIDPKELQFHFEVGRELLTRVQLTNLANYPISVKITQPTKRNYRVSHPKLSIQPGETGAVEIICEAQGSKPYFRDIFTVESSLDGGGCDLSSSGKTTQKIRLPAVFIDNLQPQSPADAASPSGSGGLPGFRSMWARARPLTPEADNSTPREEMRRASEPPPSIVPPTALPDSELEALRRKDEIQQTTIMQLGDKLAKSKVAAHDAIAEMEALKEELKQEADNAQRLHQELNALRRGTGNGLPMPAGSSSPESMADGEKRAYEHQIDTLRGERDAAKERSIEFNKALKRANLQMEELKKQHEEEKHAAATAARGELDRELEDAQAKQQEMSHKLARTTELCSEAVERCESLKEELNRVRSEHENFIERIQSEHRKEVGELTATIQQLESQPRESGEAAKLAEELAQMREACNLGVEQIEDLTQDVKALEEERRLAVGEKNALARELQTLKVRKDMVEAEGERIKQELAESEVHRAPEGSIPEELISLRREVQAAEERLEKQKVLKFNALQKLVEEQQKARRLQTELDGFKGGGRGNGALASPPAQKGGGSNSEDLQKLEAADKRIAELEALVAEKEASLAEFRLGPTKARRSLNGWGPSRSTKSQTDDEGREEEEEEEEEEDTLESRLAEYKEENGNLAEEVTYLMRDKEQMADTIANLNKSIAAADKSKEEVERLKGALADAAEERDRLQKLLMEAEEERSHGANASSEHEDRLDKLQWENDDLHRQITDLQTQAADLRRQVADLQDALERTQESLPQIDSWQQENEELHRQVADLRATLERSEESFNESERFVESLRRQVQSLQDQRGAIEMEVQRKAKVEIFALRTDADRARDQTAEVLRQMEAIEEQHRSTVAHLEATIADLKAQSGSEASWELPVRDPSAELQAQVADFQKQCEEQEKTIQSLREDTARTREDLVNAKEELELELLEAQQRERDLQDKLEGRMDEVQRYQEALDKARAKLQAEREEKAGAEEAARREMARLQEDLAAQMAAAAQAQRELRQQVADEAARQQQVATELENTSSLIEMLQKDAEEALNEKASVETFLGSLEVNDVMRRGHTLRIRQRPNYTCAICRRPGAGWAWKCSNPTCADIIHPGCVVTAPR